MELTERENRDLSRPTNLLNDICSGDQRRRLTVWDNTAVANVAAQNAGELLWKFNMVAFQRSRCSQVLYVMLIIETTTFSS